MVVDMIKPAKYKPVSLSVLPEGWKNFAQKLAGILAELEENDYLCLTIKRSGLYVRFSLEGKSEMRVEATSNIFLDEQEQMDEEQIASMIASGWGVPTVTLEDLIDFDDSGGSPNFFLDLNSPVPFETVANLVVHTFAEILRVPTTGELEYYACDEEDVPLEFPELGLKFEDLEEEGGDREDLSQLLLETVRDAVGVTDLEYDEEGEIGIRYGSALSFVRLDNDGLFVSIYSMLLTDVRENHGIYIRLNDINANETMLRVFYTDGVIYAVADIPALPLVPVHVAATLGYFSDAADRMGGRLKAEFGGHTAFEESTQSSMLH